MVSLDLWAGEKIKDGRHVGLDFYDLLIEVLCEYFAQRPSVANHRRFGEVQQTVSFQAESSWLTDGCGGHLRQAFAREADLHIPFLQRVGLV
jgi:hypothetical protein